MGEIEIKEGKIIIASHIVTYGNEADADITERIRREIENMWNEPRAHVFMDGRHFALQFIITAESKPQIDPVEVISNIDPKNNYFRVESFIHGNISFVDGLGCNSGYFLKENLYKGSTTAAHEYGHTLGLDHPEFLDIRGEGVPGIMYPRGTLVDANYQYDPLKPAGVTGGTMHPMHRRVKQEDVDGLKIHKLRFGGNKAIIGAFTNIYHWDHASASGH